MTRAKMETFPQVNIQYVFNLLSREVTQHWYNPILHFQLFQLPGFIFLYLPLFVQHHNVIKHIQMLLSRLLCLTFPVMDLHLL